MSFTLRALLEQKAQVCPPPLLGLLDGDQIANTSPLSQAQGVPHPTLSYDLLGLSTTNYHLLILLHTFYFYYSTLIAGKQLFCNIWEVLHISKWFPG